MRQQTGRVFIIGAGPGDPGLITVRGLERLRQAQTVLFDRLAPPALLAEAPEAEWIYVGKKPGRARMRQSEISELLVERARRGENVARLKGGDPFVFGRGGEEALALRRAGVPFEIIPGVSSAMAAPACAGIPITHRGMADGFVVATGRRARRRQTRAAETKGASPSPPRFTRVVLMGMGALSEQAERLQSEGLPAHTPAAVISWGATVRQQTVVGTLADIAQRCSQARLEPPATLVAGAVAAFARILGQPRHDLESPLSGRRIALAHSGGSIDSLRTRLEQEGAEAVPVQLIHWEPAPDSESERRIERLDEYEQLAVCSVPAWRVFFNRLLAAGADLRALSALKVVACGGEVAQALLENGVAADRVNHDWLHEQRTQGGTLILADEAAGLHVPESLSARADVWTLVRRRFSKRRADLLLDLIEEGIVDAVVFDAEETRRRLAGHVASDHGKQRIFETAETFVQDTFAIRPAKRTRDHPGGQAERAAAPAESAEDMHGAAVP